MPQFGVRLYLPACLCNVLPRSLQLLIADFFFILFALGWLGAGLAERSALQSTVGRLWRCCALLYCMLLLHLCVCARVPR